MSSNLASLNTTGVGFGPNFQGREYHFSEASVPNIGLSDSTATAKPPVTATVTIRQTAHDPQAYDITVKTSQEETAHQYNDVRAQPISSRSIRSFYPHTRLDTTIVRPASTAGSEEQEGNITIFHPGEQHKLSLLRPPWFSSPLADPSNTATGSGTSSMTSTSSSATHNPNMVQSPMPCKVLRVDVSPGDKVTSNQSLLVIESMKMETVVRCPPRKGTPVVKRVLKGVGEMCGRGAGLVEFEEDETA